MWNVLAILFGCLGLLLIIYVIIRRPFSSGVSSLRNDYELSKGRVRFRSPPLRWTPALPGVFGGMLRRHGARTLKYIP